MAMTTRGGYSLVAVYATTVVILAMVMSGGMVEGACTHSVCSAACNLIALNAQQPGKCDAGFRNFGFRNDSSCMCDACPPPAFKDFITIHNFDGTCVGGSVQDKCTKCPEDVAGKCSYMPHFCKLTDPATAENQEVCVCMPKSEKVPFCPFALSSFAKKLKRLKAFFDSKLKSLLA